MELFLDALLDALIDGVKMLPFLYLAYLLIEWLERHHGESIEGALAGGGRWGFIPGALLGCVPQCGFSAVASNLYASRVITPGTLLAVFIATSDEAIPLLAALLYQSIFTLKYLLASDTDSPCKIFFSGNFLQKNCAEQLRLSNDNLLQPIIHIRGDRRYSCRHGTLNFGLSAWATASMWFCAMSMRCFRAARFL